MLLTLEIIKLKQVKIKSLKAYKHPECTHSSTGKTVFLDSSLIQSGKLWAWHKV